MTERRPGEPHTQDNADKAFGAGPKKCPSPMPRLCMRPFNGKDPNGRYDDVNSAQREHTRGNLTVPAHGVRAADRGLGKFWWTRQAR